MRKGTITIAFIGAVAIATAVGLAARLAGPAPTPASEAVRRRAIADADRIRLELRAQMEKDGLAATYAALKQERGPTDVLHGKAHIFGELAYEKEGIDGIAHCDALFTFGCHHGLIVQALANEGLEALPKIDAACVAANGADDTGCRHGIGHGLVEFFGPKELASALDRCAAIQPPDLLGCTQGAFMEYGNASVDDKTLVDAYDLDAPCSKVDEKYRASCYHEQPYFWMLHAGLDSIAAGKRCDALEGKEQREACLLGFGRAVAELGRYDLVSVDRECERLSEDGRTGCLAGARWLYAATRKRHPWPCDGLGEADRAACGERSKIMSDVGQ